MNKWILLACVLGGIVLADRPTAAAALETSASRLRYERHELASPAGARRVLGRIGDAALESCGASFSLAEFKTATLLSQCWRDAVDEAVRRIDDPLLTAAAREAQRTESRR